ncbi:MAG: Maf family protein [Actinomycetota bacterium]
MTRRDVPGTSRPPVVTLPDGVDLVLASGSPRRRELLAQLGLDFEVRPADIDETPHTGEAPVDYVRRLSAEKAAAAARHDEIVVAADTTVTIDDVILEKPLDAADACRMLRLLSGRTHRCHTAVTVVDAGCGTEASDTVVVTTEVDFARLDDATIDWYVQTGEAFDKAGAYGIQGAAGAFVREVRGSVTNVIGLPLAETVDLLRAVAVG